MNLNFFGALILLVLAAIDLKYSGKSVPNKLTPIIDSFPIHKLGEISVTCKLNQTIFSCNENFDHAIDSDPNSYWRGPSLARANEFPEVNQF